MTVATMDDWNTKHDHISAPCRQAKYLSQMHCMTRQVSTIASVITEKMCIIVVMYGVCFVCTYQPAYYFHYNYYDWYCCFFHWHGYDHCFGSLCKIVTRYLIQHWMKLVYWFPQAWATLFSGCWSKPWLWWWDLVNDFVASGTGELFVGALRKGVDNYWMSKRCRVVVDNLSRHNPLQRLTLVSSWKIEPASMVNKTLADSLYGDIFHLPGARWVWGTNTTLCPSSWWFNGHLAYSSNAEKELKTQWFFARAIWYWRKHFQLGVMHCGLTTLGAICRAQNPLNHWVVVDERVQQRRSSGNPASRFFENHHWDFLLSKLFSMG